MRTPIFGPFDVSRSPNVSDNRLINLYPELVDTKQGKAVGALYLTPGLDLLATVGTGPIRGLHPLGDTLYVVSGGAVYALDPAYNATLLSGVLEAGGVSMIDNGTQIAIFVGNTGAIAPIGYALIGGVIGAGGSAYTVGDQITLNANDGTQVATAIIEVSAVLGGAVTAFTFVQNGSFPVQPTGFTQASTTGGGSGLTLTTPTYSGTQGLSPIALPYSDIDQPISAAYQDGFGVINQPGSNLWFQSDLLDLSVWNPLNFASASGDPDDVLAIAMVHREIWLLKERESEVWYNAGTPNFTFARLEGVYIEAGIEAIASLQRSGENLLWLARTNTGDSIVVLAAGHAAQRISTHAVEYWIQQATPAERAAATAWVYQQQGHEFYVLNVADQTWVYDIIDSQKAGVPLWHQRASVYDPAGSGGGPLRPPWNTANAAITLGDATLSASGTSGGGSNALAVVLDGQQSMWDLPAMADHPTGILSFWCYIPSTPGAGQVNPPTISDFFKLTGAFSYFMAAPNQGAMFIGQSYAGDTQVTVANISNASQAVVTLQDCLVSQLPAVGAKLELFLQASAGWPASQGYIFDIVATNPSTVTLDWDTSGFPAYAPTSPSTVRFCYVTDVSIGTSAVVTFNVAHGLLPLDPCFVALSGFEQDVNWFSLNNKVVKLLGSTATTLTIDANTMGFAAWIPAQNFMRAYVANALDIFLASDAAQDQFFAVRTTPPLALDTWLNVKMSWDTGWPAGSKKFVMTISSTENVTAYWIRDADASFNVGYSQASASDANASWKALGNGTVSDVSGFGYLAEYYFNAAGPFMDFTLSVNDSRFRDPTTNTPIDLGPDGSGPTGSAPTFYLSLRSNALSPPPALTWWEPNNVNLVQSPGVLGGIGDGTSMVLSWWMDRNTASGGSGLIFGVGSTVTWDNETSPFNVTVSLFNSVGGSFVFSFPADMGSGANVRVAVDTNHAIGAKIVHAYVGTVEQTITVITDDTNNLSVHWQDGSSDFTMLKNISGWLAEIWFGPNQFFDISGTQFVDGSGNPVNLGSNGQNPSGTSPTVFLHLNSGDPVTNLNTNLGTGGNFTGADTMLLTNGSRFTDNRAGTGALRLATAPLLIAPTAP